MQMNLNTHKVSSVSEPSDMKQNLADQTCELPNVQLYRKLHNLSLIWALLVCHVKPAGVKSRYY